MSGASPLEIESENGECVAVASRPLDVEPNVLGLFEAVRGESLGWLLDSALEDARLGRFSMLGADPYAVLRCKGDRVELETRRNARPGLRLGREPIALDAFEALRRLLPPPPHDETGGAFEAWPFIGGAVGYLGYELAECIERIELRGIDDLALPDLVMLLVDRVVVVDHALKTVVAITLGFGDTRASAEGAAEQALDDWCQVVTRTSDRPARTPGAEAHAPLEARLDAAPAPVSPPSSDVDPGPGEAEYARGVRSILSDIAAGNVYEVNLTQRMSRPLRADPWALYRALRRKSPAPFAAFLELPEVTAVSSSPERFLRLTPDRAVESRPIKGTRPRGAGPERDAAMAEELVTSPKDRAENLMIVDLVRNDLGRVCEPGSVRVPELMAVERYSTVFQLVSTVVGRLRPEYGAVDLVRATFPPGSMTGAPKIAAMRIAADLEPMRRSVYSGAIGYFDVRGGLDLSVVIRTWLVKKGRAYLNVGGAVVADSEPLAEYRECLDKARAPLAALEAVHDEP